MAWPAGSWGWLEVAGDGRLRLPTSSAGLKPGGRGHHLVADVDEGEGAGPPPGPVPGAVAGQTRAAWAGGEGGDPGEGPVGVDGVGVELDAGEGQVPAGVARAHEAEGLDAREDRELGRLHVVEGGEVPEPGQGHDERPPLGGAERAELGPDEEDLGLARRRQRRLAGQDGGRHQRACRGVDPDRVEDRRRAPWPARRSPSSRSATRCTTRRVAGVPGQGVDDQADHADQDAPPPPPRRSGPCGSVVVGDRVARRSARRSAPPIGRWPVPVRRRRALIGPLDRSRRRPPTDATTPLRTTRRTRRHRRRSSGPSTSGEAVTMITNRMKVTRCTDEHHRQIALMMNSSAMSR